ncbi:MAG: hypothetical protein ACPGF7_01750 [Pontibacterium sp.]
MNLHIGGNTQALTREALYAVAVIADIKRPDGFLYQVQSTVSQWNVYGKEAGLGV